MSKVTRKLFVISDIHGHYKITIKALKEKGYDENNKEHLLLVLGDIFDRGKESKEVYFWLKRLTEEKKAIVLKGNHDSFLIEFLENYKKMDNIFNFNHNGLKNTIYSLLDGSGTIEDYYNIKKKNNEEIKNEKNKIFKAWNSCIVDIINKKYPDLLNWLKSFPYYLESDNYIFTHASIDTTAKNYKKPNYSFESLLWDDGTFFGKEINNTNKIVVVGHFNTGDIRYMYNIGNKNDYSILTREDGRIIMIDACTIISKKVNVLVLKDKINV